MKILTFLALIFGLISCGQPKENNSDSKKESISLKNSSQSEIALRFINEYVENCNKMKNAIGIIEWVNSNHLTTESFKSELVRIITEANNTDPELGLGFDPIFDGQDYPEKGFKLESIDNKTNYLILQGIDWNQFRLRMKIRNVNGEWLVEGCGIVNIPDDQRIDR